MPASALPAGLAALRPTPERETVTRQELEERLEQERLCLARELHDTIGQSLTALYLNAKFVERNLEQVDSKAAGDIFEMGETIHRAVQELHEIMSRLLTGSDSPADAAGGGESRTD